MESTGGHTSGKSAGCRSSQSDASHAPPPTAAAAPCALVLPYHPHANPISNYSNEKFNLLDRAWDTIFNGGYYQTYQKLNTAARNELEAKADSLGRKNDDIRFANSQKAYRARSNK